MRRRRHTITVASSTLFFVCLMLHAQTGLCSLASTSHNDAEARKVYGSLLPADWTLTAAHARRLHIVLSPVAFNMDTVLDASHSHGLLPGTDTLLRPRKQDRHLEQHAMEKHLPRMGFLIALHNANR